MSGPADRPERPVRDERVDRVLRDVLGGPGMRSGVALGRLVRSWGRVVGTDLARQTAPVGLSGGQLVVAATSPAWAAQARFLVAEIARQANHELGGEAVRTVRVVVRPETRR
jgi:predicted nucleic acid-binding Zn ribbon protein